jgi:hypothetical protein
VTGRIIIHAGFAKCGSASIQAALFRNFGKLQKDGISLLGKELRIASAHADFEVPIWFLEQAKGKREHLTPRLTEGIAAVATCATDHVRVLSAENLANPQMASLFAGLDGEFEVSVIFYVRPQFQWIPSAWKQWGLKSGMSLSDFVSQCIDTGRPWFKLGIDAWRRVLPSATLHVRLLIPELLTGGDPARDFFHLIGLSPDRYDIGTQPTNPSLDCSILHVLAKNPHLFSGIHDNRLMRALRLALPKKFQSTNIQMLSREEESRIEESFRDENLWLLNTYCRDIDADHTYRTYFTPREAEARYSSMTDLDLIYRCLGIILESIAATGDQVASGDSRTPKASKPES